MTNHRLYAWLGMYRDHLPPSAVEELQDLLGPLRYSDEPKATSPGSNPFPTRAKPIPPPNPPPPQCLCRERAVPRKSDIKNCPVHGTVEPSEKLTEGTQRHATKLYSGLRPIAPPLAGEPRVKHSPKCETYIDDLCPACKAMSDKEIAEVNRPVEQKAKSQMDCKEGDCRNLGWYPDGKCGYHTAVNRHVEPSEEARDAARYRWLRLGQWEDSTLKGRNEDLIYDPEVFDREVDKMRLAPNRPVEPADDDAYTKRK